MKSILFARDDMTDFLEMSPPKRSEIFENIIQLNKFQSLWNNNYNKLLAVKRELSKINEEITALEKTKEKTKIFFDKEIMSLRQKKTENSNAIAEQESILKKFGKIDPSSIVSILNKYVEQKNHVSDLEQIILNQKATVEKLEAEESEYTDEISACKSKFTRLQNKLADLHPEKCEACGHIQHEEEHEKKRIEIEDDILECSNEQEKYEEKLESVYGKLKIAIKDFEDSKSQYIFVYKDFQKIDLDSNLKKKLDKSKSADAMKSIIDEIVGASDKINQLKLLKLDGSNLKMYREEIRKDSKELSVLYANRSEKTKRKEIMEILHAILDVKEENSIKNHLVSQIIPVFNTILQKNMMAMYEGEVELQFDSTMKETLVVSGHTMFPEELSTGERGKLNFVINLSIFDLTRINLNGSNIIFFDEIFTSLDKPTIKKMINLIVSKFGTDTLIHIISHDDYVKSNVKPVQVLKIVKKDDESKIVIED